jgi:RNA polymerase sigma-70 factor (ECF subfamily)
MNAAGRTADAYAAPAARAVGARAAPSMDAPEPGSTADLARRVRRGDRAAFEQLYRLHARGVHALLAARLAPHEAEDRVQLVFLNAWAARGELREPERCAAWLYAIARRVASAHARERRSEPLSEHCADPRGAPDSSREAHEEGAIVLAELRALPEAYRETLALRLLGELSGAEIAERTGRTYGSVRVNLHKGLEMLRERLKRRGLS